MRRSLKRSELIALAISLCVHGLVLWRVAREPEGVRAQAEPSQVTVIWTEAAPAPPPPEVKLREVKRRPAALVSDVPRREADSPLPNPLLLGEREARAEVALQDEAQAQVETSTEPKQLRGHTITPQDLPSRAALLADEQERVSTLVDGWLQRDLGAARVRGGLPDPSYGQLGADLRAATDDVPPFIDTNNPKAVAGALLESWGAGAARYGKTGAPYAEPKGRLENVERPSQVADAQQKGSPDMQALAQFLAAGARLQEFADGRAGLELYALVELEQHPSGALDSVTLIKPSGLAPFDTWVLERARHVGLAFTFDAGIRSKPLRSVWRFDGIVLYRRKLKNLDGRAVIGLMTMAALSMLSSVGHEAPTTGRPLGPRIPGMTGRFDELTGDADFVDLTNPTYDCRVTLLEADECSRWPLTPTLSPLRRARGYPEVSPSGFSVNGAHSNRAPTRAKLQA